MSPKMTWTFEALTDRFGGELDGPVWDGGGVLFCCASRNEIHRWDAPSGECTLVRHPTVRIRGLAFDRDGRLFAAQSRARRVVWLSSDGGTYYLNAMLGDRRHNDPQDLVVDDAGRIWFTDRYTDDSIPGPVGYPPLEHQSVLRLTERDRPAGGGIGDWTVERMTFDTAAPGGIALSPDGTTLYVVDGPGSPDGRSVLRAYAVDGGALFAARVLHEFRRGDRAGGACAEADGNVVVAVARTGDDVSGRVVVIDPSGAVVSAIDVPEPPTNVCAGGADGTTLFVTTRTGRLYAATTDGSSR